jgi:hypothetical protein
MAARAVMPNWVAVLMGKTLMKTAVSQPRLRAKCI